MSSAPRARQLLLATLPALLAFGVYAVTLGYGFVWDDREIVERQLPAFRSWQAVLLPPAHLEFATKYYRPMVFASYRFDEWLGGGAPWAFHLGAVLAHAAVTLLVFQLGTALGLGEMAAVFGAALFAVHPIHTESVAWMAGRGDVIACLLLLASMLTLWRSHALVGALASSLLLLCAMLAKEVAVVSAMLLPAAALLLGVTSLRRSCAVVLAALAPYVLLRTAAGSHSPGVELSPQVAPDLIGFVGYYGANLVLPLWPSALVEQPRPLWLFGAISIAVVLALALYLRRGTSIPTHRFLLLWIAITLTPAVLPVLLRATAAPFAERYLYLPSVGFCLLVGSAAARCAAAARRGPLIAAASLLLIALAGAFVPYRSRSWKDGMSFWSAMAKSNPQSWQAWLGLAKANVEGGRLPEAEAAYERGLLLTGQANQKGRAMLLNNLGVVYRQSGRTAEAEAAFQQAVTLDANYPDPLYNLGLQYWTRGREARATGDAAGARDSFAEARRLLEAALTLDPNLAAAHYALGSLGALTNDVELARLHLDATIRLAPNSQEAAFARTVEGQLPR